MPRQEYTRDKLTEDLGNLAKLNAGPLINVLKQTGYFSGRTRTRSNYSSNVSAIRNKFQSHGIGSTSEIVDLGVLKQGMKSLRKGFKDNDSAKAFVAYIGGQAVMFAITDAHDLAGSSRESIAAYNLTKWKDLIDQMYASQYRKPSIDSSRTEEPSRYDDRPDKPRRYTGQVVDTAAITALITLMQEISNQTGEPLTAKLVMGDTVGETKRRKRFSNKEISAGAKDLKTRLAYYKNSKKPTVGSVKEFIAMSLKNPGATVQFAGITYSLKSSSYDKIDPTSLLRGIPFSVSYKSVDPGVYESLYITYKFDAETNQLLPIKATFRDKRFSDYLSQQQEEILDPKLYLIHSLKTRKLDDKNEVMPKLLTAVKSQQYNEVERLMKSLEQLGMDWPEFAAIRKSINAVKQDT